MTKKKKPTIVEYTLICYNVSGDKLHIDAKTNKEPVSYWVGSIVLACPNPDGLVWWIVAHFNTRVQASIITGTDLLILTPNRSLLSSVFPRFLSQRNLQPSELLSFSVSAISERQRWQETAK